MAQIRSKEVLCAFIISAVCVARFAATAEAHEKKGKTAGSTIAAAGLNSAASETEGENSFSGNISWYGREFNGRKTASGELFDEHKCTAAHRRLPFFTKVLVENPKTGQSCVVRVNDRGPFVRTRVMDLAREGMHRVAPTMPGIVYADCLVVDEK